MSELILVLGVFNTSQGEECAGIVRFLLPVVVSGSRSGDLLLAAAQQPCLARAAWQLSISTRAEKCPF